MIPLLCSPQSPTAVRQCTSDCDRKSLAAIIAIPVEVDRRPLAIPPPVNSFETRRVYYLIILTATWMAMSDKLHTYLLWWLTFRVTSTLASQSDSETLRCDYSENIGQRKASQ